MARLPRKNSRKCTFHVITQVSNCTQDMMIIPITIRIPMSDCLAIKCYPTYLTLMTCSAASLIWKWTPDDMEGMEEVQGMKEVEGMEVMEEGEITNPGKIQFWTR